MIADPKRLATGALLAFVAVTAVTLGVKEVRHARAVAAAEAIRPAPPDASVPALLPARETGAGAAAAEPADAASAVPRSGEAIAIAAPPPVPARVAPLPPPPAPATIVVSYFHTTTRCASCLKIENLATLAVTTRFVRPLAEKRLLWRIVNVDEPANAHFTTDYALYTKSVVVSEVRNGREVRWKNLDQVWQLLGEPEAFQDYVEKEIRAFLEPA